jgi:NADPH:quinone reductase
MTGVTAARLVEHGKPIEIHSVGLPDPSGDEALVDLVYAGVNPVDRYAIEGRVAADGPLPRTIGEEATGHLDGMPVLISGAGLGSRRDGLFASAAVVPRSAVFELPEGTALDEAAALGVVGLTAWRLVEMAEVGADDRVLVLGGSGGVGQSAISYAASKGARVWGQTGGDETGAKANAIKEFGADEAVVTDAAGLADAVREFAPTAVLDPLGGQFTASALTTLAPRGRLVLFGTSSATAATIELRQLYRRQIRLLTYAGLVATGDERREGLLRAIEEFAVGRLRIRVGRRFPLGRVNDAFAALSARAVIGKVILELT